jgi:hypothetical protein
LTLKATFREAAKTYKALDWVARLAGTGKQAVIRFVQSYRMGYVRVWEWLLGNDLACV